MKCHYSVGEGGVQVSLISAVYDSLCPSMIVQQSCQALHGDIPQLQRERTLKGFRDGIFGVLVATNVAARGLDIPEVDLVVQCSPPKVCYCFLPHTHLSALLGIKVSSCNYGIIRNKVRCIGSMQIYFLVCILFPCGIGNRNCTIV